MTDFLVIPNTDAGELVIYDFFTGLLVEKKRKSPVAELLSSSWVGFDRENKFVFFTEFVSGPNDSFFSYALWNDGDVGSASRLTFGNVANASHGDISPDNNWLVATGAFREAELSVNNPFGIFDLSGIEPSGSIVYMPASGETDQRSVRFVSNDRFIAHEGQTGIMRLYGIAAGPSITELAEATIGSFAADHIDGFDSQLWVANSTQVRVYDFSGDTITLVDSTTPSSEPASEIRSLGGNKAWTKSGIHSFDGSTITTLAEPDSELTGTPAIAAFTAGSWATYNKVGVSAWAGRIQLYDLSGDQVTLSEDFTESGLSPRNAQFTWAEPQFSTPEQLFQASYADASAADPKVTALIRPADVQRSIDTDVSNLKDGPNLYTVEAIFDIGELENLNPYNSTTEKPRVFFVKDDQPGLREGKNLLLKGYTIRDADPAVPVTCTFWG